MTNLTESQNNSEIILYQTEDGQTRIQVRLENETVWLTPKTDGRAFSNHVTEHNAISE